jgi:hypothetical protein
VIQQLVPAAQAQQKVEQVVGWKMLPDVAHRAANCVHYQLGVARAETQAHQHDEERHGGAAPGQVAWLLVRLALAGAAEVVLHVLGAVLGSDVQIHGGGGRRARLVPEVAFGKQPEHVTLRRVCAGRGRIDEHLVLSLVVVVEGATVPPRLRRHGILVRPVDKQESIAVALHGASHGCGVQPQPVLRFVLFRVEVKRESEL